MIVSREQAIMKGPEDVGNHLRKLLKKEDSLSREREHFWIIILNTRNRIRFVELVSLGTLNASLVHPREVYRRAIKAGASALIIGHSHPSGDCEPSEDDISLTKRLMEAGKIIGIEILDHIIIGTTTLSFKEKGLL
jgi:DNA repair protein RadC